MRRLPVLFLFVALLALLVAPPAHARDVEDLAISPSNPVAEGNYEGGAGLLANDDSNTQGPAVCRVAEYCDVIDLDITIPEGYTEDWSLRITLTWPAGPDLDLTLYNDQEKLLARAWTTNNPEAITIKYMSPGRYYITVLQFDDVLVTYNVKAEFIIIQPIQPRKRSTTAVSSPSGFSSGPGSAGSDSTFGQGFGGVGGSVFPVSDPSSLQPVPIDIPEDEAERVGFAPLEEDKAVPSSVSFDGGRLTLGALSLAVIALLSYFLFFIPRRDPIRKLEPAA